MTVLFDKMMMDRAVFLAQQALGKVSPNPLVGCVLVADGRIIGEGYHKYFGEPHAEVEAIHSVSKANKSLLSKSTMYVTLEPCCHTGKTPPCTELILKNKIPKVFVACVDPFPEVAGKGIEMLRSHGVEVKTGLLQKEAAHMNRRFMTFYSKKRPYIILKWAESANGKIGILDGSQVNISGAPAKSLSHKWRTTEDAILIGKGTLLNDNPLLTNRLREGKNPVKIILAGDAKLKSDYKIFSSDSKVLIFGAHQPDFEFNGKWFQVNSHDLNEIMQSLYNENIQSVIVEGGQVILNSFLKAGLVDEFRIFRSKSTILPENAVPAPEWPAIEFKKTDLEYDDLMTAFL